MTISNALEIRAPKFPESIENGEIIAWNLQEGGAIGRDDVLVEIETDKVVMEIPAQSQGTLTQILKQAGDTVLSDELIGYMSTAIAEKKTAPVPENTQGNAASTNKTAPSAKKLAFAADIDIKAVKATGKRNTVTKTDVQAFIQQQSTPPAITTAPNNAARNKRTVPMTRLRTTIAQRLLDVQASRAILTTVNEVNLHAIDTLRKRYKEAFIEAHGVKLGFMSFFVQACCDALKKYPVINAASDNRNVTYHDYQDIGIAVSTERGLVVPVLRDAAEKSLAEIEQAIIDFAGRARHNKLQLEELQGGTFTITNGGVFGSLLSTPIINPPQSAILGMHTLQRRPIAEGENIVIRPMMYLALSYDHRIIDGKDAVLFLKDVKESLENPGRRLLGI